MSTPLNPAEVIAALRCPNCKTTFTTLDGQRWKLLHTGEFVICCGCGYWMHGKIHLEVIS